MNASARLLAVAALALSLDASAYLVNPPLESVSTSPAAPSTTTGTITSTECATLSSLQGQASVGVLITGTWTGTLTGYKSVDGTTFATARLRIQPVGSGTSGTSVTTNGTYTIASAGMASIKVCGNTVASGTATVKLRTNTGAEDSLDGLGILVGTTAAPSAAEVSVLPGVANAAAPTLTEGRQSPLSLKLDGSLRVTGPLTDAELRASPVPVSGPLTDTELRASAVPISAASLPLPSGAATAALQSGVQSAAGTPNATAVTIQGNASGVAVPISDNSSSLTVDQPTGTNLHVVTDSTSTTAVTQATGTNLHAVIDSGSTTAVTQATGTNLHTVVDSSALPSGASTLAEQQTQTASLSVIDDWDESDRAKVNPIVGQAGVAAGAGAVGATTQRVTLASDDPGVSGIGATTDSAATVGGTGSVNAKLRLSTTLQDAVKTSVEIIDDWDESDRAKVNLVVGQAGITAGAGAVAANTPRVTHASDDPVTTSVQLIDDAVGTDGSTAPTKGLQAQGTDTAGNAQSLLASKTGALSVGCGMTTWNGSADTSVKSGQGNLCGVFVASCSACTIKIWDNTAGSGTVLVNTFTPTAATWYSLPFVFGTGLYIDISGTIDLTASYN